MDFGNKKDKKKTQDEQEEEKTASLSAALVYNLNQIKKMTRGNELKTREHYEKQLQKAKTHIL